MTSEQDTLMHDILRRIIRSGHGMGFQDLLNDIDCDRAELSRAIDSLFDLGALNGEWVRRFNIDEQFGDWYVRNNADKVVPGSLIVRWNGIQVRGEDLPEGVTAIAVDKKGRWSVVDEEETRRHEGTVQTD